MKTNHEVEKLRLSAFKFGFASGLRACQEGNSYDTASEIDWASEKAWYEFKRLARLAQRREKANAN